MGNLNIETDQTDQTDPISNIYREIENENKLTTNKSSISLWLER